MRRAGRRPPSAPVPRGPGWLAAAGASFFGPTEMTLHKLLTDRETRALDAPNLTVNLDQKMYHVADGLVRARAVQACEFDVRRLPVHRTRRWSVRRKVELFFDDL